MLFLGIILNIFNNWVINKLFEEIVVELKIDIVLKER